MSGFVKIYGKILKSSVWVGQPAHLRLTWIALLVLADKNGNVFSSVPGLAQDAGVTIPEVLAALDAFQKPDPFSRTPDNEGRRIIEIDGGWRVLNHDKYREMRTESQVQNAARQAAFKARRKGKAPAAFGPVSTPVTGVTGNKGNAPLCTLYSDPDPMDQPDQSDPDPLPSRPAKDGSARATLPSGVFEAPALPAPPGPLAFFVPESWQPTERHRATCHELGLDLDDQVRRYRRHEFPRALSDWNRRFDTWLEDARKRAETDAFKLQQRGGSAAPGAAVRRSKLPEWVHAEHVEFARANGLDIAEAAKAFAVEHELHRAQPGASELFQLFKRYLAQRAKAGATAPKRGAK